ncbi:putative LRR receptor-like protein kinase [Trifolium pratense]|uniref:non-specific serine/threonine protein kinase n=1 Tax=Trifolium pratense TaxID=57577 RepID=A0A2K3NLI7_TRIPR|nr:putative LRR receptor-like protein kinase [Trifolium pratense]
MKLGLVLVIVGGVVGIACVFALLIVFILWKSKPERLNHNLDRSSVHKFSEKSNINARHVPQTMRQATHGQPPYNIFTEEEIEDATNNFDQSNLIGEGSQGQEPPQVTSTVFIVLEYISNVSLRDQLTDGKKKEMLKWPQRMAISIGIARGVQFLHTGVAPGIFGNNLKIQNILLDDSLNAKVSGYKIPLPSKSTVNEQSASNQIASTSNAEKEDIYQLGVILLEIITGTQIASSSDVEQLKDELERGSSEAPSTILRSAIDPSLRGSYAYESMSTAVQITLNCLSKVSSTRPSIEDVLWNLQYSMQVQENWTSSGLAFAIHSRFRTASVGIITGFPCYFVNVIRPWEINKSRGFCHDPKCFECTNNGVSNSVEQQCQQQHQVINTNNNHNNNNPNKRGEPILVIRVRNNKHTIVMYRKSEHTRESDLEYYERRYYNKLKDDYYKFKISDSTYRCPFCYTKYYSLTDLLIHASRMAGNSRKTIKDIAKHSVLITYINEIGSVDTRCQT